jgi:uncharacterized protein (DUF433 family)
VKKRHRLRKEMTPEKLTAIRAQAEAYLRDAQRVENPEHVRETCAFDAVYMYCRSVLAGHDEGLQHPHANVLRGAAHKLGWSEQHMEPALAHLPYRDSLERYTNPHDEAQARSTRQTLVQIAEELRAGSLVWVDPERMNGAPCFTGTRVTIAQILADVDIGTPLSELQRHWPFLTEAHIQAAREYMRKR